MKTIFNITGAVALTALATTANAASFSLSGAPASVNVGDTFNVTVVGDFPGDLILTAGAVLGYDPALFSIVSASYDVTLGFAPGQSDPSFSCLDVTCPGTSAGNSAVGIGNFGGLTLSNTAIATFTLSADAAGVSALTADNDPFNPTVSAFTFGPVPGVAGDSVAIEVLGGAVVPVPAAVWLFGSGLLGLVGVARRKA